MPLSTLYSYFFLASCVCITSIAAVPCDWFWGTANDVWPRIRDPFSEDRTWQVVRATDTYVRFQNPNDPRGKDVNGVQQNAKIEQLQWSAEREEVDGVFNNYLNYNRNNIMLWLDGDMTAYAYAGMILETRRDMSVQDGLADPNTVINLSKSHFCDALVLARGWLGPTY